MRWLRIPLAIMDTLVQDVRYALRQLMARPAFAAVTVLTLALGIGASTTVFGIANWIALRPVPGVRNQARLVTVEFLGTRAGRPLNYALSKADLDDLRAGTPALDLAGYAPIVLGVAVGNATGRTAQSHYVTENYFSVLGVDLIQGAAFTVEQNQAAAAAPIAVVSYDLWRDVLGGVPDVVGKPLMVNGLNVEVAGVAPRGFKGPRLLGDIDLWLPGPAYYTLARTQPVSGGDPANERRGKQFGFMVGRLAPRATIAEAKAQLGLVGARLAEAYPREDGFFRGLSVNVQPGIGLPPRGRETVERMIAVLAGISSVLILIALGNATNLLVFRTISSRDTLAVQRALGASRWRVARQRTAESLILSILSGLLAATLTIWLISLFKGRLVPGLETVVTQIQVDWRVFAFAVGLSALVGLLLGVLPGLLEPPADIASDLKSRLATRGPPSAVRLRWILTTGQVSLSAALLVGALLFTGTLRNLRGLDTGLDPREVTSLWTNLPAGGYAGARAQALVAELSERLLSIPGVDHVAFANSGPFFEIGGAARLRAFNQPLDTTVFYPAIRVSPDYFQTLGIPLLRGRAFTEADIGLTGDNHMIVLSESGARRFFGAEDPVGRTVIFGSLQSETPYRVIGVVGDTHWTLLGQYGSAPVTYTSMGEGGQWISLFIITHSHGTAGVSRRVREVLGELAPSMPVFRNGTVADQIEYNLTERRLLANAAALCSVLAVFLAGLGLYAVVAFSVAQRQRELGIRMALGARARQILGMVLREGGLMGGVGVGVGVALAAGLSRLIAGRLYGLSPLEPAVYAFAAILMLSVVALASLGPARAATRVDPMVALRSE